MAVQEPQRSMQQPSRLLRRKCVKVSARGDEVMPWRLVSGVFVSPFHAGFRKRFFAYLGGCAIFRKSQLGREAMCNLSKVTMQADYSCSSCPFFFLVADVASQRNFPSLLRMSCFFVFALACTWFAIFRKHFASSKEGLSYPYHLPLFGTGDRLVTR